MVPLRGKDTISTEGARAYERASPKGEERKYPRVGRRALLQQGDLLRDTRLPRRRVRLHRAQGQGERHSALHLRDDRGPQGSGTRRVRRLEGVESPTSENPPSTKLGEIEHIRRTGARIY